jgi:hypothetical protein
MQVMLLQNAKKRENNLHLNTKTFLAHCLLMKTKTNVELSLQDIFQYSIFVYTKLFWLLKYNNVLYFLHSELLEALFCRSFEKFKLKLILFCFSFIFRDSFDDSQLINSPEHISQFADQLLDERKERLQV